MPNSYPQTSENQRVLNSWERSGRPKRPTLGDFSGFFGIFTASEGTYVCVKPPYKSKSLFSP